MVKYFSLSSIFNCSNWRNNKIFHERNEKIRAKSPHKIVPTKLNSPISSGPSMQFHFRSNRNIKKNEMKLGPFSKDLHTQSPRYTFSVQETRGLTSPRVFEQYTKSSARTILNGRMEEWKMFFAASQYRYWIQTVQIVRY